MSASAPLADTCASCGSELPPRARFCPSCGTPVAAGETVREEVPLEETGEVPVNYEYAEPRWFGVAPPQLLLGLAAILVVLALVLFVTGGWPYGLILLGVAALVVAAFLEAVRRRPTEGLARTSTVARERAQSAVETWRARAVASAQVRRIRSAQAGLEHERRALLHDLGSAVHLQDSATEAAIRERLADLQAHEGDLERQLDEALASAGERIRQARLPVDETIMVLPSEPAPPPGEADPPQPAVVPEPYPPPDEGTPPQPARVPEPSPDPPAPEKDE